MFAVRQAAHYDVTNVRRVRDAVFGSSISHTIDKEPLMNRFKGSQFILAIVLAACLCGGNVAFADVAIGGSGISDCTFMCTERIQHVYAASEFPGPTTITKVSFFASPVPFGDTWNGVSTWQMNLSTSANPIGSLSLTFANNVGGDSVVFDTQTFPLSSPAANSLVSFNGSFYYDPSFGDLLVDIVRTAGTGDGVRLDASFGNTGLVERVFAFNGNVTAEHQGPDTYGLRVLFETVPEPSTSLCALLGIVSMIGSSRAVGNRR
jgi:hypothetical protein